MALVMNARPSPPDCTCKLSWRPSLVPPLPRSLVSRRRPLILHQKLSWRPSLQLPPLMKDPRSSTTAAEVSAAADKQSSSAVNEDDELGFVAEMRSAAMKRHRRDQAWEGERQAGPHDKPLAKWEPSIAGCLQFLVDSKAVHDSMESIIQDPPHSTYIELRDTGLERVEALAKDLKWFEMQGYKLPKIGESGSSYAALLKEVAEKDPPAFICHYYNVYFGHTAGGRMIGRKISDTILGGVELEFYKWIRDPKQALSIAKAKINKVTKNWTREEKEHCLQETEKPFIYLEKILHLIAS